MGLETNRNLGEGKQPKRVISFGRINTDNPNQTFPTKPIAVFAKRVWSATKRWKDHGLDAKTITFKDNAITHIDTGRRARFSVITPQEKSSGRQVTDIVVDLKHLKIDRDTARKLGDAMLAVNDRVDKRKLTDCVTFSTYLCGETFDHSSAAYISEWNPGEEYEIGDSIPSFDPMKPVNLWKKNSDDTLDFLHMITRLPVEGDDNVYIQKLGLDDIAISTIQDAAKFYDATHATPLNSYKVTDPETGETYTKNF